MCRPENPLERDSTNCCRCPGGVVSVLGIAHLGGTAPTAEAMERLSPVVLEIVETHDGNTYRALYTIRLERAVYVARPEEVVVRHPGGQKGDVDFVAERLKTAERDR